jgi:hypothetical protein
LARLESLLRVEEVVDALFHLCFLALEVPDLFLNGAGIEETRSKPAMAKVTLFFRQSR